jgi:hypothetical protein
MIYADSISSAISLDDTTLRSAVNAHLFDGVLTKENRDIVVADLCHDIWEIHHCAHFTEDVRQTIHSLVSLFLRDNNIPVVANPEREEDTDTFVGFVQDGERYAYAGLIDPYEACDRDMALNLNGRLAPVGHDQICMSQIQIFRRIG